MSDYLWDKTGEPDAEAERLEELLGQLRFQPTPFDLPAGLPAQEFRAARTRNVLSWPRLAVAASVTLAVLAGAWLMFKQQTGATNDQQQAATRSTQPNAGGNHSTAAATKTNENNVTEEAGDPDAPSDGLGAEAAALLKDGEKQREEVSAGGQRPRLPDLDTPRRARRAAAPRVNRNESARAPKREKNWASPPHVEPARREETAAAERAAAEKVLYALRVTSEKLNYARQQVREAARGEDNR